MKNKKTLLFSTLLLITTLYSCVSKKKYVDLLNEKIMLKSEYAQLKHIYEGRTRSDSILLKNMEEDLSRQHVHFDTTVNSIITTANNRVDLMNAQYAKEIKNQLTITRNTLFDKLKKQFEKYINAGLVTVNRDNQQVQMILNVDSLYNPDSLSYNATGLEIITELAGGDEQPGYSLAVENLISYRDSSGHTYENQVNNIALTDLLELIGKSYIWETVHEQPIDMKAEYLSQKIRLNFKFGFNDLDRYYFGSYAKGGQLIMDNHIRNKVYSSMVKGLELISLDYGDNNNIKYLIYPSIYMSLKLGTLGNKELVRTLQKIESRKYANIVKVEGRDRTPGICGYPKAVIILSMDNTLLKRYPQKYIICENPVFDLNL
jgi:hypothetical protein